MRCIVPIALSSRWTYSAGMCSSRSSQRRWRCNDTHFPRLLSPAVFFPQRNEFYQDVRRMLHGRGIAWKYFGARLGSDNAVVHPFSGRRQAAATHRAVQDNANRSLLNVLSPPHAQCLVATTPSCSCPGTYRPAFRHCQNWIGDVRLILRSCLLLARVAVVICQIRWI